MGCLLVEMFRKRALFQGKDEISQLDAIYNVMGTPNFESWPAMRTLPWYQILLRTDIRPRKFDDICSEVKMPPAARDLAGRLLAYDPNTRISAKDALYHEYFSEEPKGERPVFKELGEWHDFEAKQRRRKEKERSGKPPGRPAPGHGGHTTAQPPTEPPQSATASTEETSR
jgi:CTD kinase subunit alpha